MLQVQCGRTSGGLSSAPPDRAPGEPTCHVTAHAEAVQPCSLASTACGPSPGFSNGHACSSHEHAEACDSCAHTPGHAARCRVHVLTCTCVPGGTRTRARPAPGMRSCTAASAGRCFRPSALPRPLTSPACSAPHALLWLPLPVCGPVLLSTLTQPARSHAAATSLLAGLARRRHTHTALHSLQLVGRAPATHCRRLDR